MRQDEESALLGSHISTVEGRGNGTLDPAQKAMIRSHSIPGELHGLHAPDPVAADILRKEPEQEVYVRLQVSPVGKTISCLCGILVYISHCNILLKGQVLQMWFRNFREDVMIQNACFCFLFGVRCPVIGGGGGVPHDAGVLEVA